MIQGPEKQRLDRQAKQQKQRKDRQYQERLSMRRASLDAMKMQQMGGLANYRFYSAAPTRSSSFASAMIQGPEKQRLDRQAKQQKQRKDRQYQERRALSVASMVQNPDLQRLDRQAKQQKQRKDRQYQERLSMRRASLDAMKKQQGGDYFRKH
jgi:hypothetical protein